MNSPTRQTKARHALSACVLSLAGSLTLSACAESTAGIEAGPVVEEASHELVVVGQTLELSGRGFLTAERGVSRLAFEGRFIDSLGRSSEVNLTVTPHYGGELFDESRDEDLERQLLTWGRVGPFNNPFTRDERTGKFVGIVSVLNSYTDGLEERGPAVPFELEIGPSLLIERFEPLHADCGAPAARALGGLPYHLSVKTSGLAAERFVYELNQINGGEGAVRFEHSFEGQVTSQDTLGDAEPVVFNEVPEGQQAYVTELRVIAYDKEGRSVETALPISVHRPLEVIYDGSYELAERLEPVPVSGCIPGGIGSNVSYSESVSETRTQRVSMAISQRWSSSSGRTVSTEMSEGIEVSESERLSERLETSEGEQLSESMGERYNESSDNEVGFSSSDGEGWSWDLSQGETQEEYDARMSSVYGAASAGLKVRVKGEGGIGPIAKASGSVTTSGRVKAGASRGQTFGGRSSTSVDRGYSTSGSSDSGTSFGSTVSEERSRRVRGTYALGSDTSSSSSSSNGSSRGRVWDLSEESALREVSREATSESLRQAQSTSSEVEVSQTFSGYVPRDRYGIFYRQTTRWVRRALVRSFDLCGVAQPVGELQFNEWEWAPDLAIGETCDALPPPSTMPAAGCFIEPCGE